MLIELNISDTPPLLAFKFVLRKLYLTKSLEKGCFKGIVSVCFTGIRNSVILKLKVTFKVITLFYEHYMPFLTDKLNGSDPHDRLSGDDAVVTGSLPSSCR